MDHTGETCNLENVNIGVNISSGAGESGQQGAVECAEVSVAKTIDDDDGGARLFTKILELDLVAERLISFLNFEDMKILSEVSTAGLKAVRKSLEFASRAKLKICREVIQSELLKENTYLWRHLSLDLSVPKEVVDIISDLLDSAESLFLTLPRKTLEDCNVGQYLEEVLKRTKNLLELGLDAEIMTHVLHDVFSNTEIQKVISNLQVVDIRGFTETPNSPYYLLGEVEDVEEIPFQRNFLQLSMVPLNLKKFAFGKVETLLGSESDHAKFIPNIISAAKNTLEDIELNSHVWKFNEMTGIRCPNLKRLTLSTNGDNDQPNAKIVETFLKNQPPLEELSISLNNEFPVSILLSLEGMLMKMKKFHLKAKRFSGRSEPMDWSFLETMTELKDFSLRKPFGWGDAAENTYGYGEDILIKLPSETIRKITLQGFQSFWRDEDDGAQRNIGLLLARFKNLKELNLLRSSEAVTDEGLQSIIENCSGLIALTFSHCSEVSDYGISGVIAKEEGGEKTGFALNEITGLSHLKIRSCPNITPECLLRVVKCKFLRSFDYYRNVELGKEFLYQIADQNPCLERIALHISSNGADQDYLGELKQELKRINSRVHSFEILEESNWEDEDSDSDASSEHAGSSISGGHFDIDYDDNFDDYDDFNEYDDDDVDEDDYDADFF